MDRKSGQRRRHRRRETVAQRAVRSAVKRAGRDRRTSCHTLRRALSTHLRACGCDIRTIRERLGHKDLATAMIDTHGLNRGGREVETPLDRGF